jgi:hypothetical protein
MSVHVDDFLVLCDDEALRLKIYNAIEALWPIKDLGVVELYLAIHVVFRNNGEIHIHQKSYIESMVERYNLGDAIISPMPMSASVRLSKEDCPTTALEMSAMESTPYRSLIGSLLYAALGSRPDIAYAVNQLSRFNSNPGKAHWVAARKVLKYLKGTKDRGITYKPPSTLLLNHSLLCDSDWGQIVENRRSVSGFVNFLSFGPISWLARTQKTVALSSCEAEFLSLIEALKEALWLSMFLDELGVPFRTPLTIQLDNQSAINLSENAVDHARSKHIDIRYFRIRDDIDANRIKLLFIPGIENTSDLLTKPVTKKVWDDLIGKLITDNV